MEDIQLSKNKYLSTLAFSVGVGLCIGITASYFLFPLIPIIKNNIYEEAVCVVEKSCEPIEEEKQIIVEEDTCPIIVDVSGAVKEPGVYCLDIGSTIVDAVQKAEGFLDSVAYKFVSRKINLSQELNDNQKLYFPFEEDSVCTLQSFSVELESSEIPLDSNIVEGSGEQETQDETGNSNEQDSTTESCVNINTATLNQLTDLNGVGESTAQKIIDARPFNTISDILSVSGIGDATFEKFKDQICI